MLLKLVITRTGKIMKSKLPNCPTGPIQPKSQILLYKKIQDLLSYLERLWASRTLAYYRSMHNENLATSKLFLAWPVRNVATMFMVVIIDIGNPY